jgi:hypothetical protein
MKYGDGTMRKIRQGVPSIQCISSIPLTQLRSWNISRIDEDPNAKLSNNQVLTNQAKIQVEITETKESEAKTIEKSEQNKNKSKFSKDSVISFSKGLVFGGIVSYCWFMPLRYQIASAVCIGVLNAAKDLVLNKEVANKTEKMMFKLTVVFSGFSNLIAGSDLISSIQIGSAAAAIGTLLITAFDSVKGIFKNNQDS